jgi:hypothetical protein
MKTLLAALVIAAVAVSEADAAPTPRTASAALAAAERLCALPKGAESIEWHVVSTDSTAFPSPVARSGRYWLVVGRFDFPSSERMATVIFPVLKIGALPVGCSIIPAPDFSVEPQPHPGNSN